LSLSKPNAPARERLVVERCPEFIEGYAVFFRRIETKLLSP
jgi:hypothetical protein